VLQISQLEFSRDRKMMSVRCRRQGQDALYVKGAPEAVLARCSRVSQITPSADMACAHAAGHAVREAHAADVCVRCCLLPSRHEHCHSVATEATLAVHQWRYPVILSTHQVCIEYYLGSWQHRKAE
jgi:magnesium-transporting ATPase (P-type)